MSDRPRIQKAVEVPAIYVWMAGKLAEKAGDAERTRLLSETLASGPPADRKEFKNVSEVVRLRRFAASAPVSTYIPFVRSPLDVYLSAQLLGAGCWSFKLYSEASLVELGYIRVAAQALAYVDRRSEAKRYDAELSDPFTSGQVKKILTLASSYALSDMKLRVDHRDGRIMSIVGDLNSLAIRVEQWPARCSLSLWAGPEIGNTGTVTKAAFLVRKFGHVLLERQSDWELSLTGLRAEQSMELTAGSLVGQWILLEHESFRFLGPIPDLTESELTQPMAFDPYFQFLSYSLDQKAPIKVSKDIAHLLSNEYPWFVPADPVTWLENVAK